MSTALHTLAAYPNVVGWPLVLKYMWTSPTHCFLESSGQATYVEIGLYPYDMYILGHAWLGVGYEVSTLTHPLWKEKNAWVFFIACKSTHLEHLTIEIQSCQISLTSLLEFNWSSPTLTLGESLSGHSNIPLQLMTKRCINESFLHHIYISLHPVGNIKLSNFHYWYWSGIKQKMNTIPILDTTNSYPKSTVGVCGIYLNPTIMDEGALGKTTPLQG